MLGTRRALVARASQALPGESEVALGALGEQVQAMQAAEEDAARHAALVHAVPWVERAAGGQGGWARLPASACQLRRGRARPVCPAACKRLASASAALIPTSPCRVPRLPPPAGLFEPPPPERFAVASTAGLVLNNASTLLFMVGPAGASRQQRSCLAAAACIETSTLTSNAS